MKKTPTKVAHNMPQIFFQHCQPAQNQPKSQFLFHENWSLRDLCIMTLPTGCVCWFDLEGKLLAPNSCACCRPGGRQCGYPKQDLCTKITKDDDRTGCNGTVVKR